MKLEKFERENKEEIANFERRIGFKLPMDFKAFLTETNGGVCKDATVLVPKLGESVMLNVLFGFHETRAFDLKFWWNEYGDEMPDKFCPIASDHGGNLFLLQAGEESGIFYWDHTRFFKKSTDEENTYFITSSFADFFTQLEGSKTE